jgi:tetratricopeptide (TPR) repeat protein
LGVAYIVEGSVRRAGDRVRITAQLIQVSDQTHLWAENYERDLKDIFALQSDVAERVAGLLTVELLPEVAAKSARTAPINPAAHEAYLKGRFHWNKRTPDELKKSVEYFDRAIELAPDWPLGYAGLADAYVLMPQYSSLHPSEAIPKARTAAAKALETDESLAEAHATMGVIATTYDWNWPIAEREYERALALNPNYATGHFWYALHLMTTGRHDAAIREITRAQELDPLSLIISANVGWVHYAAGDLVQAETWFRKTLELDPEFPTAHMELAITLLFQRKFAEAITEAREAVRLSNNESSCAAVLGYVYAKTGHTEQARAILGELAAASNEAYVAPTDLALLHAGLDERDQVFEWLERAYREHDLLLPFTLIDPHLAPIRTDPRFADLVRRVGLPEIAHPTTPVADPERKASPGEYP